MDRWPLVSIITIVYNGEKHIEDAIRSVQQQNYPNLQYIIVDGGSTDNTLGIIQQFRDTVTDLISEKDEGISDAFNKGLLRAKGEIVGMINADDWYADGAIEKAVRAMEGYDVVYGDLQLWRDGQPDFIFTGDHTRLRQEMRINHPTVFVRKNCYDRFGLFDKQYKCAMDYDLLLRLMINGCRFNHLSEVLANMRWDGLSDTRWLLGCRETLSIKNRHLPHRKMQHRLYFYKHVLAISAPKLLKKSGLGFLIRMYRG
jgi:glycosyltransferase involved in cell wall biosynthesis